MALIGKVFVDRIQPNRKAEKKFHYFTVERVFAVLMVVTACGMAFAHGSNDVANAIGPVAAVISIAQEGVVGQKSPVSIWILLLGGMGIVVGLATFGRHVIATVGTKITHLTPSRGFAAELGAATTIVLASGTGIPISTTHTLVGGILGVGIARGISAIDLSVVGRIFLSWIITIPIGGVLAIVFFFILKSDLRLSEQFVRQKKDGPEPVFFAECRQRFQPSALIHSPPWKPQPISRPPGSPS